ncbi:hypothetical protein KJ678_02705 [Patescibacteria group bacterium]|nr:hypothetical protein [Patescibacteria group bacterium]
MRTGKFFITEEDYKLIASTPEKECWICDVLINSVRVNQKGIYLTKKALLDEGIAEHLMQIVKRDIVFI